MNLPEPNQIPPTAENIAFARAVARAHFGVPLPEELPAVDDRMNGFVVTVDADLSIKQRWDLARQIAELSGVHSVENLTVLLRGLDRTFTERLHEHWGNARKAQAGL